MLRAIVFDFDGVILESVAVKARAFRDLMPEDPALQDRIERYHLENLGMSRYEKFAWMYRELLRRPLSQLEMSELDRRFGAAIAAQMRSCPFVAGALEFLGAHEGRLPLFVASGTPEAELRAIIEDRGLTRFFREIYGCPTSKTEALAHIWRAVGGVPEDILFIGDSQQDADAAHAVGVMFVARVARPGNAFRDLPVVRVEDLTELERRLPEIAMWSSGPRGVS